MRTDNYELKRQIVALKDQLKGENGPAANQAAGAQNNDLAAARAMAGAARRREPNLDRNARSENDNEMNMMAHM